MKNVGPQSCHHGLLMWTTGSIASFPVYFPQYLLKLCYIYASFLGQVLRVKVVLIKATSVMHI